MPRQYTDAQKARRREANRAYAKRRREANRERHREERRQYRARHRAEVYARNREWAKANPGKVREYHRSSRRKNPESYHATALRWRAKHPTARALFCAARRAKKAAAGGTFTEAEWVAMKRLYGDCCLCCGKRRKLTIDHIVPIDKGGRHSAENIQPLCLSCNSGKCNKTIDYRPL